MFLFRCFAGDFVVNICFERVWVQKWFITNWENGIWLFYLWFSRQLLGPTWEIKWETSPGLDLCKKTISNKVELHWCVFCLNPFCFYTLILVKIRQACRFFLTYCMCLYPNSRNQWLLKLEEVYVGQWSLIQCAECHPAADDWGEVARLMADSVDISNERLFFLHIIFRYRAPKATGLMPECLLVCIGHVESL